jgi:hypothetical protein
MALSRRALLRAAVPLLAVGTAGCVYYGPFRYTSVAVSIRESFAATPSVAVPVSVEVVVQNVDSTHVALREVELVALDENRNPLQTRQLGDKER